MIQVNLRKFFFAAIATASITTFFTPAFADTVDSSLQLQATSQTPVTDTPPVEKKSKHKHKITQAAAPLPTPAPPPPPLKTNSEHKRLIEERSIPSKFGVAFNRPTYVLPYYYTFTPDNAVYQNNTPNNEELKNDEIKYQLSFKVPLWRDIFHSADYPTSLFFAYTQMSYWQAYDKYAFFRETDFEPEVYLTQEIDLHLGGNWRLNFLNLGAAHQSNGFGNSLERSWNRVYVVAVASSVHWMVAFKPWIVFHDSTFERQNPNMVYYMGHEQMLFVYKYNDIELSLETRNFIESGFHRSGNTLSLGFPVNKYINGYLQVFSGYGQSLIEYNHRTNSVGIGVSLSNWI